MSEQDYRESAEREEQKSREGLTGEQGRESVVVCSVDAAKYSLSSDHQIITGDPPRLTFHAWIQRSTASELAPELASPPEQLEPRKR